MPRLSLDTHIVLCVLTDADEITDAGKPEEEAESADVSDKPTEKSDNNRTAHLRRKSSTLQTVSQRT